MAIKMIRFFYFEFVASNWLSLNFPLKFYDDAKVDEKDLIADGNSFSLSNNQGTMNTQKIKL